MNPIPKTDKSDLGYSHVKSTSLQCLDLLKGTMVRDNNVSESAIKSVTYALHCEIASF